MEIARKERRDSPPKKKCFSEADQLDHRGAMGYSRPIYSPSTPLYTTTVDCVAKAEAGEVTAVVAINST